jgi:hypothetical protein
MPSRRKNRRDRDLPESAQMFRYFVDLRDLRDGSARAVPLRTEVKFHIPTRKNERPGPSEEVLQTQDGATTLEAMTFDDLVTQLRHECPDGEYERTLRRERDHEAEHAMNDLMRLVAEAAVKKHLRERNG